ncbi:hypothetical protein PHMEG_00019981 [Phytophthora megakarya]|uniref:Reverse transcriptase n=1 Tax=Phytophthora megakarya TaxID=4795 RepID=A0A225VRS6_9STRA|nr:hypothetical protein PHMEG_00019981 [Phytophthora megakarya]
MAKDYQAVEKARRARIHNEKLSRKEQAAIPKGVNDGLTDDDSDPKSLFRPRSRVWLYMERVKPSGAKEFCDRPKTPLARDVAEEARFDFDKEMLSENNWMPDEVAGEFEVEAILDDRIPMSTSTDRPVREFEVKWEE